MILLLIFTIKKDNLKTCYQSSKDLRIIDVMFQFGSIYFCIDIVGMDNPLLCGRAFLNLYLRIFSSLERREQDKHFIMKSFDLSPCFLVVSSLNNLNVFLYVLMMKNYFVFLNCFYYVSVIYLLFIFFILCFYFSACS